MSSQIEEIFNDIVRDAETLLDRAMSNDISDIKFYASRILKQVDEVRQLKDLENRKEKKK